MYKFIGLIAALGLLGATSLTPVAAAPTAKGGVMNSTLSIDDFSAHKKKAKKKAKKKSSKKKADPKMMEKKSSLSTDLSAAEEKKKAKKKAKKKSAKKKVDTKKMEKKY